MLECQKSADSCGCLRASEPTKVRESAYTHTHTGLTVLIGGFYFMVLSFSVGECSLRRTTDAVILTGKFKC